MTQSTLNIFTCFSPLPANLESYSTELLIGTVGQSAAVCLGLSGASCTVLCMSSKWDRWRPCRSLGPVSDWLREFPVRRVCLATLQWSANMDPRGETGPCAVLHHVIQHEWQLCEQRLWRFKLSVSTLTGIYSQRRHVTRLEGECNRFSEKLLLRCNFQDII